MATPEAARRGRARKAPIEPVQRVAPRAAQMRARLRTVRDALRYTVTRLEAAGLHFGHGTDNAFDEAVWLVLWSLHLPPDRLDPYLDAAIAPSEIATILEAIDRRCNERVPLAYLLGEAWLRARRFLCDARALVPRSPIAEAIEEALDAWLDHPPASMLDLCTGGGSLAIIAAQHWPNARIDAADLSAQALALAARNLALHQVSDRVTLMHGDLLDAVDDRRYDLILCNPPYVNQRSIDALPQEYRHEPGSALAGGADGMDLVRTIMLRAPAHLRKGGALLLEIGHERPHFERAFPRLEFAYLPVQAGEHLLVWCTRDQLVASGG